jgi:hypothetical protein
MPVEHSAQIHYSEQPCGLFTMPKGKGVKQKDEAAAVKDGEGFKII